MNNTSKTDKKTLTITRIINAPVERVYKAFLNADAMAKWLPPHGFTGKVTESDYRVDGHFVMKMTNFSTGSSTSFGGKYVELVENKLIRYNDYPGNPDSPDVMETTIEFEANLAGTKVTITQTGISPFMPLEFATLGWQSSLQLLEQLVVPAIPDN